MKISKKLEMFLIVVIILIASFFRIWHLGDVPNGLYPDEAINGNSAIQALESGDYKVFYVDNNGREGLYINLVAGSFKMFGNSVWSLRLISALAGILGVLGLYLLTRELFNKETALISSFLMAVSFWHVLFSRIGFRAMIAPALLTFAFYFLWRGLKTANPWYFSLSGIVWGLGFYTYIAFRAAPLILIIMLLAYWHKIKKDFGKEKYLDLRNKMIRGFILTMLFAFIVFLPLGYYFFQNPADFLGRTSQISIFSQDNPIVELIKNLSKSLQMFNFVGDLNWRHNFSGSPQLIWPIGITFLMGLVIIIKDLFKRIKDHGHLSVVPILLLSWFGSMILPAAFSSEGLPHALRVIIVAPVIYIFAGIGTLWLFRVLRKWYQAYDINPIHASRIVTTVLIVFLFSIGVAQFDKYFNSWGKNQNVLNAFSNNYVKIAEEIKNLPENQLTYVVVEAGGALVDNIPMPAQTVMFLTDTSTEEKQKLKNIFYILPEDRANIPYNAKVFVLE